MQAGAQTGYLLGWVVWWSTLVGLILQLLSVRLGVVTGLNLAQMCRKQYSKSIRYALWVCSCTALRCVLQNCSLVVDEYYYVYHCICSIQPHPKSQIMIEIAIIASDIQEVLGSAIAIAILSNNAGIVQ